MAQLTAFVAGLLFAAGLGVGGMTQPAKVFGFLDVAGNWDPSLAFVMLGAIAVHATAMRRILRRRAPLFAVHFALPTRRDVDARLVTGAAVFGAGWGLVGYCPGPAVTALGGGIPAAAIFVPAMIAGMWVFHAFFERPKPARAASGEAAVEVLENRRLGEEVLGLVPDALLRAAGVVRSVKVRARKP